MVMQKKKGFFGLSRLPGEKPFLVSRGLHAAGVFPQPEIERIVRTRRWPKLGADADKEYKRFTETLQRMRAIRQFVDIQNNIERELARNRGIISELRNRVFAGGFAQNASQEAVLVSQNILETQLKKIVKVKEENLFPDKAREHLINAIKRLGEGKKQFALNSAKCAVSALKARQWQLLRFHGVFLEREALLRFSTLKKAGEISSKALEGIEVVRQKFGRFEQSGQKKELLEAMTILRRLRRLVEQETAGEFVEKLRKWRKTGYYKQDFERIEHCLDRAIDALNEGKIGESRRQMEKILPIAQEITRKIAAETREE